MNSKDIGTCILNYTNDRKTLFNLSVVCKTYNRSFNEMKNKLMKRYGIDLEEYELYRDYNFALKKDMMRQKDIDENLKRMVVKFLNKAFKEQKKHTLGFDISEWMSRYPKSLYITSTHICHLIVRHIKFILKTNGFELDYMHCGHMHNGYCVHGHYAYDVINNGKIVYRMMILSGIVIFINAQPFEKYLIGCITKIIKRNRQSGRFILGKFNWEHYRCLVPKNISNHWAITNCLDNPLYFILRISQIL